MASHVKILLNSLADIVTAKSAKEEVEIRIMDTFRSLISQLNFYSIVGADGKRYPIDESQYDSPIMSLWPTMESIYRYAEKATKREHLRDSALLLLAQIIKVSPHEHYSEKLIKFLKTHKILTLLEQRRTF